jgi:hypothetical protein
MFVLAFGRDRNAAPSCARRAGGALLGLLVTLPLYRASTRASAGDAVRRARCPGSSG